MTEDIRALDRRVVQVSADMVATLAVDDLAGATPCAGWTLADLVAHMAAQHRGFAAAAAGLGGDLGHWAVDPSPDDPVRDYLASVDQVLDAFAADGVLDREFLLAEFSATDPFPAAMAIGFHFIDYLVHSWDVARSLSLDWVPDDDLVEAALPIARNVPNGAERLEPGAAFAPAGEVDEDAPVFETILVLLGRSPGWSAPVTAAG